MIVPDTGSAYGGKHTGEYAVEAARLARAAGKPVKLVWTRKEEFSWGYFRPAGVIEVKAGVDAAGQLTVWEFDNWNSGGSGIQTPYEVANQRVRFHPSESPLRQGSYRGLAATANHYAREMHIDSIARALGVDPVAYRLRHLKDERMRAVLTAAAQRCGWPKPCRQRPCDRDRVRHRERQLPRDRRRGQPLGERATWWSGWWWRSSAGRSSIPTSCATRSRGAVIQGLGGALFEAIEFANGAIVNGSDGPLSRAALQGHAGSRGGAARSQGPAVGGAGETPIVCVAPAIGSAVRGLGRVLNELPVRLA